MSTPGNSSSDQKKTSFACKDCSKTFVRSEHLSRHRLNHRPKKVYSCSQCPKEFVRSDLLFRHQKRHEKGMHYRSTGGVVKRTASQDGVEIDENIEDSSVPSFDSQLQSGVSGFLTSPVAPAPHATLRDAAESWNFDSHSGSGVNPLFFDPAADFQDIPNDLDWFFQDVLQKTPSAASEYEAAPCPIDMFPYLQQDFDINIDTMSPWVQVSSVLRSSLDGLSPEILNGPFFDPANLTKCYDLYFNNYHPHFPFLHRPSLVPVEMPPLLLVAIVALGATLSEDPANFEFATKIHDDLRFRMCRSETFEPPVPLWCLQTLLLIQAHGKMASSRKHHELAHIFHGTVITLMRRGSAYTTTRSDLEHYTSLERAWHHWVETESSKRTAFFAFVMDSQHSSLFGHTPVLSVNDIRLALPCSDSLWEASTPDSWTDLRHQISPELQFLPTLRSLLGKHPVPASCSAYARFILLHGIYSIMFHLQAKDSSTLGIGTRRIISADLPSTSPIEDWREILDRSIDTWSFSLLSQSSSLCLDAARSLYRMAHITIYTSIIDIHIVASAPSLLGILLSTNDKAKADIRIRAWSENVESRKALNHSLLLIQETLFTGKPYRASEDNISLRPWCLYHATLVAWAFGYMNEGKPTNATPAMGAEEYLVRMRTALASNGDLKPIKGANRTRNLILTIRESFRDCRWELLQEAYSTLGRLIDMAEPNR